MGYYNDLLLAGLSKRHEDAGQVQRELSLGATGRPAGSLLTGDCPICEFPLQGHNDAECAEYARILRGIRSEA